MPPSKQETILQELYASWQSHALGLPGTRFLTVRELGAQYGVSLKTAFHIMGKLREEGVIAKEGKSYTLQSPVMPEKKAASSEKMVIGFLATCLESPFFAKLACCAEELAYQVGATLVVASSNYDFQREKERLDMFVKEGVSGIMISPWASTKEEEAFYKTLSIPFVMVGRAPESLEADAVLVDNRKGARKMAAHLCRQGLEEFAYIGQAGKRSDSRLAGFREGLLEYGIPQENLQEFFLDQNDHESCRKKIFSILKKRSGKKPLGVFCYHDLFAMQFIHCAHALHIDIPGEVAIAGFDDLPGASEIYPALTSVSYPVQEMARMAFEILYAKIRFRNIVSSGVERFLDTRLVIRQSTNRTKINTSL